jgi:hypothetical protein
MRERRFPADGKEWRVFDIIPLDQMLIAPDRREGWLCFESTNELRRLAPIPRDWEAASLDQLFGWLESASRVRPSPPAARHADLRLEG